MWHCAGWGYSDSGLQISPSLTWSTAQMRLMKTNHGEEVAPSLVVVDSGWTSVLLIFVALFFSPPDYYYYFFFQSVLGRWRKLVQATLLATRHPCYSTVKGMGKLVGLHSLHQMSEMLLNGRLVNHFRFHLSYHVHLHKGNYLYGTLICLYSLWEKSWFNRNETSDHPEGVIILQCHLALQPSPRWEDAPQVVLAS